MNTTYFIIIKGRIIFLILLIFFLDKKFFSSIQNNKCIMRIRRKQYSFINSKCRRNMLNEVLILNICLFHFRFKNIKYWLTNFLKMLINTLCIREHCELELNIISLTSFPRFWFITIIYMYVAKRFRTC